MRQTNSIPIAQNTVIVNELLDKVDRLKAELDALRPLSPEQEGRVMQKFRLDWNYHSNAIEGNSLTYGETIAFLMEGLTAKGKPFKDHLGKSKDRTKLIRRIVDTRNYFTHYSETLESNAVRGDALWVLCQRMEVIFQLHLLQQLGFSTSEIQAVLAGNYRLKQKLG